MATLREMREAALLTQQEVATKLGVSFSTVSLWERGLSVPQVGNLRKLAELYGVPAQAIKDEIERSQKPQNG